MKMTLRDRRLFRFGGRPSRRISDPRAPRGRRLALEPLEDRRLLSLAFSHEFDYDILVSTAADPVLDFGDAPDPLYPTLFAANGARHAVVPDFCLGTRVDAELDGLPSAAADGDDADNEADEDGVVFASPLVIGQAAAVEVTASAAGLLDAWIDFNDDGDWSDEGEQVFTSELLGAGVNSLTVDVPYQAAMTPETFARFRFSSAGGLSYDGPAPDGEVEDYAVAIHWFGPTGALNTDADSDSSHDYDVQVATDGSGHWVAVWDKVLDPGASFPAEWDILVSRSEDHGATWTAPVALNTNAAEDSGNDLVPHVSTDGAGHWVAVWHSTDDLGGTIGPDEDILVSRSEDNGVTWTDPAALNTQADSDSPVDGSWSLDGLPQVANDGKGHWVAVWESTNSLGGTVDHDTDILVSHSEDNGATWSDPAALNSNAGGDSGISDHRPQL